MRVVVREKVVVDLYCGGGGTTTGMQQAAKRLGLKLRCVAVNHNIFAIATHSTNHPDTKHFCMSVEDVAPTDAVPDGYIDLLWASLECTHHSNARGGAPMSDQSRSSANDLLRWCRELDVETVMIENVREFQDWGPLYDDDIRVPKKFQKRPIKEWKGEFYHSFLEQLEMLGYTVEARLLNAADYGDPTSRKRLFIQAQKRKPIVWPAPTHGTPDKPHRTAREIINWEFKGKSIFGRKKPLAPNTMRRILAGLEKFGSPELKPFLVVFRNNMDGRSLDRPLPAVCTSRGHFGLAEPFLVQYFGGKDVVSVEQPLPTVTANYEHYALCEPYVIAMEHSSSEHPCRCKTLDEPLQTITGKGMFGLIEPYLVEYHGGPDGDNRTRSLDQPLPTQDCSNRFGLAEPFLTPFYGNSTCASVDEPLDTVTTRDTFGLCQPEVCREKGGFYLDIRFRMLTPGELAAAMSFPKGYLFHGGREQSVKQIGNAVPIELATALCVAVLEEAA